MLSISNKNKKNDNTITLSRSNLSRYYDPGPSSNKATLESTRLDCDNKDTLLNNQKGSPSL